MACDIRSMTLPELKGFMETLDEPAYRAAQVFQWLHQKQCTQFSEMTNLSKGLREKLGETAVLFGCRQVVMQESALDGTRKYLFALSDEEQIESVLMRYKFGNSVCISSQAGCRMGCSFCASTLGGLKRNLLPSEMLDQIYAIERALQEPVNHVVVMGTGEPFDNYANLVRFLRLLTDENGKHLSQRNITVSTCGLAPKIRLFAEEGLKVNLAVSLHAATQEKREKLMPVAKSWDLSEILDACRFFFSATGRRVTFEYSLIAGENDTDRDAEELCRLLHGMNCHVNLIPVNPVTERGYKEPDRAAVMRFSELLNKKGVPATVRREMGRDIDGACGQLRARFAAEP